MSQDAAILDSLLSELAPVLEGRTLGRARSAAPHALTFELGQDRSRRLWLDASRRAAGIYLLDRDEAARLEDVRELPGRDRQALLLARKHADGRRVASLTRVPGTRTLRLEAGALEIVLRLSGTPALSLVLDGERLATLGEGVAAWPLPAASSDAPGEGEAGEPALSLPRPWDECQDRDLAPIAAVALGSRPPGVAHRSASWTEAAALFLSARRRGARFEAAQRAALSEARREVRRLARLESHLVADEAGLAEPETLRREGEALLAAAHVVPGGAAEVLVADPRDAGRELHIVLDPRLTAAGNADRLFTRARRIARARAQVTERLAGTRRELEAARSREAQAAAASDLAELTSRVAVDAPERTAFGTRHYLTTKGLSILVGRGARENHHLTFEVARPEDLWLHAREVPGAHVIVRDNEGRAAAEDIREAAELAAFFSDARAEARVDVHVTRRKHVRAAKGGAGRVNVFHSDTMRVAPRDPEGRLRRR